MLKFKVPALQVALDVIDLDLALKIAEACVKAEADILEAGTPLIKSVGVRAVKELKSMFPGNTVSADMKTMDTGGLEVEIAAKAGADIVSVLGVADDTTIAEACEAAKKYNVMLQVDLIGHPNPLERIKQIGKLDVDIVCLHIGVDVQRRLRVTAEKLLDMVKEVKRIFSGLVAVAGGIKVETVEKVVKAGADIVIVGSAITKSPNPERSCREIVEKLKVLR